MTKKRKQANMKAALALAAFLIVALFSIATTSIGLVGYALYAGQTAVTVPGDMAAQPLAPSRASGISSSPRR